MIMFTFTTYSDKMLRMIIMIFYVGYSRGTHDPNLSGNSEIKSSFILSFIGPNIITGRV